MCREQLPYPLHDMIIKDDYCILAALVNNKPNASERKNSSPDGSSFVTASKIIFKENYELAFHFLRQIYSSILKKFYFCIAFKFEDHTDYAFKGACYFNIYDTWGQSFARRPKRWQINCDHRWKVYQINTSYIQRGNDFFEQRAIFFVWVQLNYLFYYFKLHIYSIPSFRVLFFKDIF